MLRFARDRWPTRRRFVRVGRTPLLRPGWKRNLASRSWQAGAHLGQRRLTYAARRSLRAQFWPRGTNLPHGCEQKDRRNGLAEKRAGWRLGREEARTREGRVGWFMEHTH